jgi:hypothetical protein
MGWNAIGGENTKPVSENRAKVVGQPAVGSNLRFGGGDSLRVFPVIRE